MPTTPDVELSIRCSLPGFVRAVEQLRRELGKFGRRLLRLFDERPYAELIGPQRISETRVQMAARHRVRSALLRRDRRAARRRKRG